MNVSPPNEFTLIHTCETPEGPIYDATVQILKGVFMASDEQINAAYTSQRWAQVRHERDYYLKETDWTQNADVSSEISSKWVPYRQALRDITNQSDPDNITWPEKPL